MTVPREHLILEAIVTTETELGGMHVAPMGPEVDQAFEHWLLKPFQSSTTFRNLRRTNRCVVHVVDNSLLIAQAVLGQANGYPAIHDQNSGYVLEAANHWYALEVIEWDVSLPRSLARCRVTEHETRRPFFGWNRAKHAIVELAIVASRLPLLDEPSVESEIQRTQIAVEKTGGPVEREALRLLEEFIASSVMADDIGSKTTN
jgi:uncharacterized protein